MSFGGRLLLNNTPINAYSISRQKEYIASFIASGVVIRRCIPKPHFFGTGGGPLGASVNLSLHDAYTDAMVFGNFPPITNFR